MENAIIEQNGDPKIKEAVVNGIKAHTIEFHYLITPLKEGLLTIPSLHIQGGIPVKTRSQKSSFFDDDFEPFFSMSRFGRLKPFTLAAEEVSLDVQSPVAGITLGFPLVLLKLKRCGMMHKSCKWANLFLAALSLPLKG